MGLLSCCLSTCPLPGEHIQPLFPVSDCQMMLSCWSVHVRGGIFIRYQNWLLNTFFQVYIYIFFFTLNLICNKSAIKEVPFPQGVSWQNSNPTENSNHCWRWSRLNPDILLRQVTIVRFTISLSKSPLHLCNKPRSYYYSHYLMNPQPWKLNQHT